MNGIDILTDMGTRPGQAADRLRDHLTSELLNAHPCGHPNSIAWLLWHAGREIDVQVAQLSGQPEVWTVEGFDKRLHLGKESEGFGYGQTPAEARSIRTDDAKDLLDYLGAATDALETYIMSLTDEDLDRVVDPSYDPPVTRGVRLVSIISDATQHIGQAAYIAGMPDLR